MTHVMLDFIGRLLKRERVDYIWEMRTAHANNLNAVTIKYVKDSKYFVSVTYFTDTWAGASPFPNKAATLSKFADIAEIVEVPSKAHMERAPVITDNMLNATLRTISEEVTKGMSWRNQDVNPDDNVVTTYHAAPFPCIVASVWSKEDFIGSFSIFPDGDAKVIVAPQARIHDYVAMSKNTATVATMCLDSKGGVV